MIFEYFMESPVLLITKLLRGFYEIFQLFRDTLNDFKTIVTSVKD